MIVETLAYIAAIAGVVGTFADGFTTWQGVKKFGPSIEGNKSWFAQFMVKHPSTLLYLEPGLFTLAEGALIWSGPYTDTGGYIFAILAGVAGAVMHGVAAYSNYKINKGKS